MSFNLIVSLLLKDLSFLHSFFMGWKQKGDTASYVTKKVNLNSKLKLYYILFV